MANKKPEQIIQTEVFRVLTPLMVLQNYEKFMAFQIRNETGVGGAKGAMLGAFAKAMGTMEGVSDTVFLFPARRVIEHVVKGGQIYRHTMPNPKIVFVEFKAMKPLKTKERDPLSLLSDAQIKFKERVERLGFEYKIVAATDVNDALNQVFKILRCNGVKV